MNLFITADILEKDLDSNTGALENDFCLDHSIPKSVEKGHVPVIETVGFPLGSEHVAGVWMVIQIQVQ